MACMELSLSSCAEIGVNSLETCVSRNLASRLKEVKPLVLYSVEHRIAM